MASRTPGKILILISILLLGSCTFNALYDAHVDIPEGKWYKNDAVRFEVDVQDNIRQHDFILNIRNTSEYRYSNLFVFLTTQFPNGNITQDTIECVLADNTGKWLGKGWGNIKENRITLKAGLKFPENGKYEFLVQQAMRTDTLEGIVGVGLTISNTE